MSDIAKTIGQRIRNYRTQKGLSQEKLAELSGCHATYIGQLERGEKNATLEKAGGIDYITTVVQSMPSSANYPQCQAIVKRDCTLRRLIKSSEKIATESRKSTDSKKTLQFAESEIFRISEENETSSLLSLADYYDPLIVL